jgi:hypothetical protein
MTAPATADERRPRVRQFRRAMVGFTALGLAASSLFVMRSLRSPPPITSADSAVVRSTLEESIRSRGEPAPPPLTAPEVALPIATAVVPTQIPAEPRVLPRRAPPTPPRGPAHAGNEPVASAAPAPYDAGVPVRSDPLNDLDFK